MIAEGGIIPGYGVDEGAALHYVDDNLHAVVTSHPDVTAYAVTVVDGVIQERALEPHYLFAE